MCRYYFQLLTITNITWALFSDVTSSLRINKLNVPKNVSIELECDYDLEGESLYSVKWYKDNHEFYRYIPNENPAVNIFPVNGIKVNVSETKLSI